MAEEGSSSLEYTPTWVVAFICFVIVTISLIAERGLHRLGKCLKHRKQNELFEALQKLQAELMLLGFISLLLTVSQQAIVKICVPPNLINNMLPCKKHMEKNHHLQYSLQAINKGRRLLATESGVDHCAAQGKVPLLSLEALHHLHIFVFVLAVVHAIFSVTTVLLGGARIRQWKQWEDSIRNPTKDSRKHIFAHHGREFFETHTGGYWRRAAVVSWLRSFLKQFYGSVTKADYITLRQGFIMTHCPRNQEFNFHKYMMRTLDHDFKKVVSISWYLWLFVVLFLLLNVEGWHTYFWLSFLPIILLLLVGAKLEHIISRLALEVSEKRNTNQDAGGVINPSDKLFWFHRPGVILRLVHFILFQNAFEIAFFFWIWSTYGIHSCIMEKLGYLIPRLVMGVIVQVLCSYSTLPLYALVSQMGSKFKKGIFDDNVHSTLDKWVEQLRNREESSADGSSAGKETQAHKMETEPCQGVHVIELSSSDTRRTEISDSNNI